MKATMLAGLAALGVTLAGAAPASAQGACGRNTMPDQFDSFYAANWSCDRSVYMDMVNRFAMDKGDWDGERGWNDACNDNLPLKRTFNALQLLAYGVTNNPTCNRNNANVAFWAYCYAGNAIDELDASCDGGARAVTSILPGIQYTELMQAFFYDETVVQRAATIFHEARHAEGKCEHTSGCLDGNDSCDPGYNEGCVGLISKGGGPGANGYTVRWLAGFATSAQAGWTNTSTRENAVKEANYYLWRRFEKNPCFWLDSNGKGVRTC
jgi:hypothetical protein